MLQKAWKMLFLLPSSSFQEKECRQSWESDHPWNGRTKAYSLLTLLNHRKECQDNEFPTFLRKLDLPCTVLLGVHQLKESSSREHKNLAFLQDLLEYSTMVSILDKNVFRFRKPWHQKLTLNPATNVKETFLYQANLPPLINHHVSFSCEGLFKDGLSYYIYILGCHLTF